MKKALQLGAIACALGILAGCATTVDPDYVGLYYMQGQSDGNHFDHCVSGGANEVEWNNSIIKLPTSLRTWNIAPNSADQKSPITVASKPEEGQPSGVQVNVWSVTNMKLNTDCGKDEKGGVITKFWENIGRRYEADTEKGWVAMMEVTVVPALTKAIRDNARLYTADDMVANANGVLQELQTKVSAQFSTELNRLTGGQYFCGPTFIRGSSECGQVEISVTDVDYSDPGIQDARNGKQKALETAAANLATAQGKAAADLAAARGEVNAANELSKLYKTPSWVQLQLAEKQLQIAQACAASPKCQMVLDPSGNIQVHVG